MNKLSASRNAPEEIDTYFEKLPADIRALMKVMAEELKGLVVTGATIHFTPEKSISDELITEIVSKRVEEVRGN